MGQNDTNEQPCMSIRCCCKLIEKYEEKPVVKTVTSKPRNNDCGGRPKISLCDFLKSQPIPDWIKVNDTRMQQHQQHHPRNEQCSMKPTSDERKGNSVPEDMQSSQIIINFGTVVTSGVCKRDSSQQTDPEVTVAVEKKRVCQTNASPPVNRPTSVCPPPNQSTSTCSQSNRPTSICSPAPANRLTSTDLSTNRPTTTCPPLDQSTSTSPQTNRPTSNWPSENRPTPNGPPINRSTSNGPQTNRPTTICSPAPANRLTSTNLPTNRPTTTCPPLDQSTSTSPQTNRPTSNCPSENRSTPNGPPINRSTSNGPQTNRPTTTCSPAPANRLTSTNLPTNRPTSSCPPVNRSNCPAARPDSIVNKSTCSCNCHSKL